MSDLSPSQERSVRSGADLITEANRSQHVQGAVPDCPACARVRDSRPIRAPGWSRGLTYAEMVARIQDACVGDEE